MGWSVRVDEVICFAASCLDCGWRGPITLSRDEADRDREAHWAKHQREYDTEQARLEREEENR